MRRLFIDSSVLFSAAYSTRGHAHGLIRMGVRREVELVIGSYVLEETRRNLEESDPELVYVFDVLVKRTPFKISDPTKRDVVHAARIVMPKDAPIVAAARKARIDMLVTFDRKHLLGKPEVELHIQATVVTPHEAVKLLTCTILQRRITPIPPLSLVSDTISP